MKEGKRLALVLLPWLALPLVAGVHLALWDRLPERMAVKFDTSGAAGDWMGRGMLLGFEAVILLFVLAQYTFKLLREPNASRAVLLSYYAGILIITAVFLAVLKFNL